MSKRDYYEVLGVLRDTGPDELKKSYRRLAVQCHPDKNPGNKQAEEQFKELSEAYQILSNPETRAQYDRFGHAAFNGHAGFNDFSAFAEDIFGDIFGAFFGNTRRAGRRRGGRDLRVHLEITLEEAAFGAEREITIPRPVPCRGCKGSGARSGTVPESCAQCGGSGQIRIQQGFFTISRPCTICGGQGQVIKDPCPECSGQGQASEESKLKVKLPAGINEGQSLKLRGEGEKVQSGGPPGDLFVEISIKPHEVFRRQETEILCEIPITFSQAALGAELEVPTLEGPMTMKIPPGTQSGTTFRLRGKGIVDMHSNRRGDEHVRTFVVVPKTLSERERVLLEEMAQIEGKPVGLEGRSFFDKVKEFFE